MSGVLKSLLWLTLSWGYQKEKSPKIFSQLLSLFVPVVASVLTKTPASFTFQVFTHNFYLFCFWLCFKADSVYS